MVKWKDFLYFSKNDRIAIILLSILIVLSGSVFIYMNNLSDMPPANVRQAEELQKEFTSFEEEMIDIPPLTDENQSLDYSTNTRSPKKNKKEKTEKLHEGQTLDINVASKELLIRIPGIGETFGERIVEYRNQLGGFANIEQLTEVKGITPKKFSAILPFIVLKKKNNTIKINKATDKQLLIHPYLNEDQVAEILRIRRVRKITSIHDLSDNINFTEKDLTRVEPYLTFE